ncbi:hypothetical protein [Agaribacterium haliotis]|uniref:hypothetical protein n=1 Tax=Agaribacterium haliotis TaxID=2013869 RepID=UPI000BB52BF7|nr:hypothetical protein [Agaribacterium haliotis]
MENQSSNHEIDAADMEHGGEAQMLMQNKEAERQQIQADIEAFLAGGGKISAVGDDVMADPPKKPESSYGSQPI